MSTEDEEIAVHDLETGGLDEARNPILAYGVHIVRISTLEVVRSDEFKVSPEGLDVDPKAAEVNGYTVEGWRGALSQHEGIERYRDFLGDVKEFASWNTWFDRRFLHATSLRTGVKVPLDYHTIDIVGIVREALVKKGIRLPKYSLNTVATRLGLEPEPALHLPLQGADKALEVWRAVRAL